MAGLFLWSGGRDEFSDGQKKEIHSVSALRKIPMHGGGSDLAAGLNHVMRGPRGSESLSEKIDFTPKGGRRGKTNQSGGRNVIGVVSDLPRTSEKSRKSLVRSTYVTDVTR